MRRVVLRVRDDAVEEALDGLLPRLADGVHERPSAAGGVELVAHALTAPLPAREELVALAGDGLISLHETAVPRDWHARRRLDGEGGVAIAGRIWLRSPLDPEPAPGLIDVVVARGAGFGTGAHPTTRMCLELLAALEPRGAFADLGCGAGALAIAAAQLGFAPVVAVDHDPPSVAAAQANALRNGVDVDARACDLFADAPPAARVVAANVPPAVHAAVAQQLAAQVELVIASGIRPRDVDGVGAAYAAGGLRLRSQHAEGGWTALVLERADG